MSTPPNPDNNWSIPQRQPVAGLIVIIYKAVITVIKTIWPLLLVLLFREKKRDFDTFESLLIIIPFFILLRSVVDFFYFRFFLANEELVIKKGFLSKKSIAIPLDKIQAVHIEQTVLHQLLNIVKLKIDTAGSEKAEATIDALDVGKAELLKSFLLQGSQSTGRESVQPAFETEPLIRLSGMDVLKLGISANHIQAFFIVLAFGISSLQSLEEIFGYRVIRMFKESSAVFLVSAATFLGLVIAVMIISIIVSLVRIALNYFDFTLNETNRGFRIKSGLINTKQNLVPFSKIQYVSWSANWIRRKIRLYILEFHQANSEDLKRRQRVTIPVTKKERLPLLLSRYHPDIRTTFQSVHRIDRIYPFRKMLLIGIPLSITAAAIAFSWWEWYAFTMFFWAPYIFINAMVYRKNFHLFISTDALQVNSGVWGRESRVVKWHKIQHISVDQSIYQRKNNLANISLFTAAGAIRIPYISLDLAYRIQNYGLFKIETGDRW